MESAHIGEAGTNRRINVDHGGILVPEDNSTSNREHQEQQSRTNETVPGVGVRLERAVRLNDVGALLDPRAEHGRATGATYNNELTRRHIGKQEMMRYPGARGGRGQSWDSTAKEPYSKTSWHPKKERREFESEEQPERRDGRNTDCLFTLM